MKYFYLNAFSRNHWKKISVIYAHTVVVLHHFSVTSISRSILSIQILNGLINKIFHDLHNFKFTKISFDILYFQFEFRFILIDVMSRFISPNWKCHSIFMITSLNFIRYGTCHLNTLTSFPMTIKTNKENFYVLFAWQKKFFSLRKTVHWCSAFARR